MPSVFLGHVVLFTICLRPAFKFAPQPAGDFACHCGNALFILLSDGHALTGEHPVEDQVLDLVRDQFVCHGGEVQLTQIYITKKSLPLLALLSRDVVRVALVLALEVGGVVGNIDVDPLFVVVEIDAEIRFCHFLAFQINNMGEIIYPIFLQW